MKTNQKTIGQLPLSQSIGLYNQIAKDCGVKLNTAKGIKIAHMGLDFTLICKN